ncbi:MAG: hypothetical protein K6G83_03370 [Lachnospiraceae bacterium]|nr:hypothetical protein [Lachnospiraceae bacterium]
MDKNDAVMEELFLLDREALMEKMAENLDRISGELNMIPAGIAWRTGLDKERVTLIAAGKRKMKWSEYMSILFMLWDDDRGRQIIEERGLFPDELKRAMAVNRNAHGPA